MNNLTSNVAIKYYVKQALYFSNRFKGICLFEKALDLSFEPKFKFIDTSIYHLFVGINEHNATYETFNHINQHLVVMGHEPLIDMNELFNACPEIETSIKEVYAYLDFDRACAANDKQPVEFTKWLLNKNVLNDINTADVNALSNGINADIWLDTTEQGTPELLVEQQITQRAMNNIHKALSELLVDTSINHLNEVM
ncbi:hypothetical protein [Vibrio gangliei]|uniref:hypothetical protein n=1 Tax=Vibrio gangliei TaxID=2077090 RepID=UPI000D01DFDF|nr:hypothetical protein [Vibrio gangliei]